MKNPPQKASTHLGEVYQRIRLTAARDAWRRDKAHQKGESKGPTKFDTWPEWWESEFGDGQTWNQYVAEKRSER